MLRNTDILTKIDAADDLKIAPYRPDMNTTGLPTWGWEGAIDNRLFMRAYNDTCSKWYQAALSQQAGTLLAIVQEFTVLFAKTEAPELGTKYRHGVRLTVSSPGY